jgi:hypothetical protein
MAESQSHILSPARAHHLATSNLTIFSNPDATARLAAMPSVYSQDIVVYEPSNNVLRGYDEINAQVGKLLTDRDGWAFVPTGEVKLNQDFVGVTWGFGPKGADGRVDVKVTGTDVNLVEKHGEEEAKIKKLYVVIDGVADARA